MHWSKSLAIVFLSVGCAFWPVRLEAADMKAGAAKAVISADKPRIMVTGKLSRGKDHDIFARCLVLNDGGKRFAIVTYDLNCLDVATPILRKRCRDELGIGAANLILLGTHNHEAPIQIVPGNFDYGRWLAGRLFDLIKEAIAAERGPAKLLFGTGHAYFLWSMGNAPVDHEVQLLKVVCGNQVVALLFNHATHPLQASSDRISVGHPGYAVDDLEAKNPGALALYADACGGNQFAGGFYASMQKVQSLGRDLAEVVNRISESRMQDVTGPFASKLEVISLPLAPPVPYDKALALAKNMPLDIGLVPYPDPRRGTNWIRSLIKHHKENLPFPTKTTDMVCTDDAFLVKEYDTPREFPCRYEEVIVSRIGPMLLIAMQGEVCAPIGMRIKDTLRRDMPVMMFAYMGEHNLYIPTRELVRLKAYQAQVIQTQYACPVGWAPEVEDEMVNGVIRLARSMAPDKAKTSANFEERKPKSP